MSDHDLDLFSNPRSWFFILKGMDFFSDSEYLEQSKLALEKITNDDFLTYHACVTRGLRRWRHLRRLVLGTGGAITDLNNSELKAMQPVLAAYNLRSSTELLALLGAFEDKSHAHFKTLETDIIDGLSSHTHIEIENRRNESHVDFQTYRWPGIGMAALHTLYAMGLNLNECSIEFIPNQKYLAIRLKVATSGLNPDQVGVLREALRRLAVKPKEKEFSPLDHFKGRPSYQLTLSLDDKPGNLHRVSEALLCGHWDISQIKSQGTGVSITMHTPAAQGERDVQRLLDRIGDQLSRIDGVREIQFNLVKT